MTKLEQALAALPYEERRDALNYYEEYFDSAGQENEAQTIADLGSPEEVARSILESSAVPVSDAAAEPKETKEAKPKKASSKKPYFTSFDYKVLLVGAVALLLCKFGTTSQATLAPSSGSSSSQPQTVVSSSVSSMEESASSIEEPASSTEEPASSTTEVSSTKASDEPADLTLVLPISDLQDVLELELAYGNVQFKTSPADTENSTFEFEDFLLDYLHQSSPAEHQTCFTYKLPEDYDVSHLPEASLTITLPENVLKKLKLKLAMGDVSLGELSLTVRVNLAMGDLSATSLTTSSANVNLAMGDLEIETLDCEEPDIRLAMGETEIGLLIHSEDLTLENAMGDIKLTLAGTPSDYNFTVHTPGILRVDGSSYKLRYESTSDSDRHARITSSIGNVTLSFQN